MRFLTAFAALALLATAAPVGADAVTFDVTLGNALAAEWASCPLDVAAGATVADVLDVAVAAGCIESWESYDAGFGRYVTCIDGICEQAVTYWALYMDGEYAGCGIDCTYPADGAAVELRYETWATYYVDVVRSEIEKLLP